MTLYVDGKRVAQRADVDLGAGLHRLLADRRGQRRGRRAATSTAPSTRSPIYPTAADATQVDAPLGGLRPHVDAARRPRPTPTAQPSTPTSRTCTGGSARRPAASGGRRRHRSTTPAPTRGGVDPRQSPARLGRRRNTAVALRRVPTGSSSPATQRSATRRATPRSCGSRRPRRSGGKLIGFGNATTGHVEQLRPPRLHAERRPARRSASGRASTNTITTSAAYNDGQWHHVVATQGRGRHGLYVDGVLVGTNPQTGAAGVHRLLAGRRRHHLGSASRGSTARSTRSRSTPTCSAPATVAQHFALGSGTPPPNVAAVAAFTATHDGPRRSRSTARRSTDPDGTHRVLRLELRRRHGRHRRRPRRTPTPPPAPTR